MWKLPNLRSSGTHPTPILTFSLLLSEHRTLESRPLISIGVQGSPKGVARNEGAVTASIWPNNRELGTYLADLVWDRCSGQQPNIRQVASGMWSCGM
mmetsp:Transcript_35316/g.91809  ORF Transcript_35316/g.91809 Transcript_35316/m.91809 type:complete len:97 (-) Transcript_35316:150-440(-)